MSNINDIHQDPKVDISVKNFGPISEANIDLRPLTVFIGPSNTGKTYFSTLVYVLYNAFNGFSGFSTPFLKDLLAKIAFELRGDASEIRSEVEKKIVATFNKLNTKGKTFKLSDLPQHVQDVIQTSLGYPQILLDRLVSCLDIDSPEDMRKSVGGIRNAMMISLEVSEENQKFWDLKMVVTESDMTATGPVDKDMLFRCGDEQRWNETPEFSDFLQQVNRLNKGASEVYYLPATRSGLMQSHAVIASSLVARATRAGFERLPEIPIFPEGISEFLQQLILYKGNRKPNSEMMAIATALETNVLYGEIIWQPSPSGYPDFRYRPREMAEDIRLTQASSMVSELAPLVLFIRGLIQPGDTLIIEEPEAHLHPGAQTEIAATLARLVRAGVRVIVTTHSDWLLKEIGNLIREGILKEKGELRKNPDGPERWLLPDEVGAWHFHKEKPVERLHFTNIDGIEPSDYEDLAQDLYNRSAGLHNQLAETEGNHQ